jgi:drug/metabolite transporter (DMT)-like permease
MAAIAQCRQHSLAHGRAWLLAEPGTAFPANFPIALPMTAIMRLPQNVRLGIALVCCGVVLFAVGEAFVKVLVPKHAIPQIVWARYVFHAMVFFVLFPTAGIVRQLRTTRPVLHVTRSLLMLLATTLFFTALRYLPLADAVAINFAAPLLVTALSIPLLGEKVGWRRWCAIVSGFLGVMLIIRPGLGIVHWAAVLPLGTAVCYSFYQVLTRIAARTDNVQTSLFWTSAVGVLVTSCIVPFYWVTPTLASWGWMMALGAVYGIGHYLLIRGLEIAEASVVSPFIYTQIIWAGLLGYVFFDNLPDAATLSGAAIVISSGLYIWWRETKRG